MRLFVCRVCVFACLSLMAQLATWPKSSGKKREERRSVGVSALARAEQAARSLELRRSRS